MDQKNDYNPDLSSPRLRRGTGGIFLLGFMGCGKSYWGKQLGQALRIPFFDLDEQIEQSEGRSINDIFAQEGEEYFRQKEKEVLMLLSETHQGFVISTGGGTPCFFNNIDYMNQRGTTIWLNCTIETLQSRLLKEKAHRPLLQQLGDEELKGYIVKKLGDRKIFYQQAQEIMYEEDQTLEKLTERIYHEAKQ